MKQFILIIYLVFLAVGANSQDFAGTDVNLYLNATAKPIEAESEALSKYMYKNFYLQFDSVAKVLTKDYIGKKKAPFKPYQTGEYASTSVSEYAKLVGIEYVVTAIYEEAPKYEFDKGRFFVFKLDNQTGTIYYLYDSKYKHDLELSVVGGLKYPEGYFCTKITQTKDKFEDKITFRTPITSGVTIIKSIDKGAVNYYLSVEATGATANVGKTGMIILFSDGTKWSKEDAKIDVNVNNNAKYVYSAFVSITKEDIEIFKTHLITDERLYIYDKSIKTEDAAQIQEYFNCLENLK